MEVWMLEITTELSDKHSPILLENKPSDQELEIWLRKTFSDEFPDDDMGPGIFGSFLYLKWTKTKIDKFL